MRVGAGNRICGESFRARFYYSGRAGQPACRAWSPWSGIRSTVGTAAHVAKEALCHLPANEGLRGSLCCLTENGYGFLNLIMVGIHHDYSPVPVLRMLENRWAMYKDIELPTVRRFYLP